MSQNLRNFTAALYGFDAVVQRVAADRWDNDSPCDGWTARDVLAHQCAVLVAVTQIARTGEMAGPGEFDLGDDPVAAWNGVRGNIIEALDRQGALQQEGKYFFGMPTVDALIGFVTWDPLGHAWDIAQATGQDAHANNDVAAHCIATIEPIQDTLRQYGVMTEAVETGDDADAMTRFIAMTGRNPNR